MCKTHTQKKMRKKDIIQDDTPNKKKRNTFEQNFKKSNYP